MKNFTSAKSAWNRVVARKIVGSAVAFCLMAPCVLYAADKPVSGSETTTSGSSEAKRARELLNRAVAYYQEKKDLALAAFNRQGEFIHGDLYVYVIGTNGVMLASGGSSSALIGRDVTNVRDAAGKLLFIELLDKAQSQGSGIVEYRWLNRTDRKVERKVTYFQKTGDVIIAVGYYIPHATAEQAKVLLSKAVRAVKHDPTNAFKAFNDLNGDYVEDDLYVFVVSLDDGRFRAHGATPRLVGTDSISLQDPSGKAIIKDMISAVKTKGQGEIDYVWRNPVTGKVENKHTFLNKVDNFLIGVGYYTK